jgi:hypothetical protein
MTKAQPDEEDEAKQIRSRLRELEQERRKLEGRLRELELAKAEPIVPMPVVAAVTNNSPAAEKVDPS